MGHRTSIVAMALFNILGAAPHHRWMLAFAFGLVHGFGFAFALRESLQFAGSHLVTALLAFNVGVELGQLAVLLVERAAAGAGDAARSPSAPRSSFSRPSWRTRRGTG
ncbi:MAG: HupE/UreJ family protein [Rubrivivax sp.]